MLLLLITAQFKLKYVHSTVHVSCKKKWLLIPGSKRNYKIGIMCCILKEYLFRAALSPGSLHLRSRSSPVALLTSQEALSWQELGHT